MEAPVAPLEDAQDEQKLQEELGEALSDDPQVIGESMMEVVARRHRRERR